LPKPTLVAPTAIAGATPVPARLTALGLPTALCAMLIAAPFAPVALGRNVTVTVQLAPTASAPPQLLLRAN
jgi:hypothetical protein